MHRTLDDLAAEVRPMVFRLLDAGKPQAAAELIGTYAGEADEALWREVLAPVEVEVEAEAVTEAGTETAETPTEAVADPAPAPATVTAPVATPVAAPVAAGPAQQTVEPAAVRPGKQGSRARSSAGARARAAVGR